MNNKIESNENKGFSIALYAFQSFRHYGGKSIIFMIALAVTMVLALLNMSTSLQRTMIEQAISVGGDAQFKYSDVTPEQIGLVKEQKEVEWAVESVPREVTANFRLSGWEVNYRKGAYLGDEIIVNTQEDTIYEGGSQVKIFTGTMRAGETFLCTVRTYWR